MSRFNEGIVFTNNKCVGCNKCISTCPSLGANVSSSHDGNIRVNVSKKCIECGLCLSACGHGAREFRDDCETVFEDLWKGEQISVLVDPSFYVLYKDKASEIFGFLKSKGVHKIYDVAYGAEISMYYHAKYVKEHMGKDRQCKQFIANTCAAVNNYVECLAPALMPLMIPVHTPVMCTAVYVRKYLGDNSKLVSLTPCVTQVGEIKSPDNGQYVSYCMTYASLLKYMKKENVTEKLSGTADLTTKGVGNTISTVGGFLDGVSLFFPKEEVFTHYNSVTNQNMLNIKSAAEFANTQHSLMISIEVCEGGCVNGTGVPSKDKRLNNTLPNYKKIKAESYGLANRCNTPEEYYDAYTDMYRDLDMKDFMRNFQDRYRQPYIIPEDAINEIFLRMHKDSKKKQTLNCQSCGYKSCRELAIAVSNGYARIQDCVHFMNDDLQYTALIDKMTGIPNREGFKKKARQLLEDNPDKDYILMVGNVNKLKLVNDLYGSDKGDEVLVHIAKRLSERLGDAGACGRFGGGVFAAFMEDVPEIVEPFMAMETVNVRHLGVFFPITIRYGTYKVKDRNLKLGDVVNLCTYAADRATNRTKNTFVEYDDSMRREMQTESDITLKMRDAMENGEFVLFLQPQYNHKTGKMVGAEALSRWMLPEGGMMSPGLFIPVFEKNGFVKELDKYVWENAFKLVQKWEGEKGKQVPVSVNISRISLENDEIVDVLANLSRKYPINKDNLYFEITESAYMKDQAALTERIYKIKELGFRIAMDDFGSGYSSLNSLKDIPIDVLKLDMGFLRGGTNVERGNEIIAHMVDMGKALELDLVAEGVETKDQADFLTKEGCNSIQGYYYAKPMPISEFEEKVKNEV